MTGALGEWMSMNPRLDESYSPATLALQRTVMTQILKPGDLGHNVYNLQRRLDIFATGYFDQSG